MVAPSRLVVAPYGPAATRALAEAVAEAKTGDPMAPVTVVPPSAVAGVTLRRRLASDGGLVNVRFALLHEVASQLAIPAMAAAGRRLLSATRAEAAAASVLAADPGSLGVAAHEPSTAGALVATFTELAEVDDTGLARLARSSRRAADVVRLYRAFRRRTAGSVTSAQLLGEAASAVDGGISVDEVGPVIVHLPRRLRPSELALLAAIARQGHLLVILGRAGLPDDEPSIDLHARLAPLFGDAVPTLLPAVAESPEIDVARALDPAEEARTAVRRVVEALGAGVPADRIALVARVREPYMLLLHEELAAAGIAHRSPAPRTLAQTAAGRSLVGLLSLVDTGLRRSDVMGWLRSAPIIDPDTGRPVPGPWWDRLARRAGVAGGLDQWEMRLARAIEHRRERQALVLPPESGEPAEPDVDRVAESLGELAGFVARLATRLRPPSEPSWRRLSGWAGRLLHDYLDRRALAEMPAEQAALEAVHVLLDELGELDGAAPPIDSAGYVRVVQTNLDRPAAAVGTLGQGLILGSLADMVGADLDLVVVLGAAEGQLPPGRLDDPLLPNRERWAAGVPLRGLSPAEEHRDLLAALASAPSRLVTVPRADPRGQRQRHPSRWLLDLVGVRLGHTVTGPELDRLSAHTDAPWFRDVVSFEWWLASGLPAATAHEHDVGAVVTARGAGLEARRSSPALTQPELAKGLAAVEARRSGGLGEWTGLVGPRPEFLSDLAHPQSSTALENWVVCPFRYFLGHVLDVAEYDDPAESDFITALDRGSLVHAVLEAFVGEAIDRPPHQPWTADERRHLHDLADRIAAEFEAEGRTGRPLLWELTRHGLHRQLDRILDADDTHRATRNVAPVAVEHAFGFGEAGHDALRVMAGEGQEVVFRGRIDRIDRSLVDDSLVVLDYKTGDPTGFPEERTGDLTGGGRYLQLLVYAAAARAAYGDVPVEANYWFVGDRGQLQMRGGVVDEAAEARFREVLGIVVDGVAGGRFPARPGKENYVRGFEHCRWCPYDRVCGTDRAEQWQRIRGHQGLAAYRHLVEPDESEATP